MKLGRKEGKIVRDGKDLLLSQAALSFQFFTEHKFSIEDIDIALETLVL